MQLLHWHLVKFWYLKVARLDFLGGNTSQVLALRATQVWAES